MTQCLVTGGAGFIGSHLVDALLAAGRKVRVLDDLSTGKRQNLAHVAGRVEIIEGSITNVDVVQKALAGCTHVFHLAALPSVPQSVKDPLASHEICATGTLNVLNAARLNGVKRLVYAASCSAYGDQEGAVRVEEDALLPASPYAAAKVAGEHYCQCFTAVYGLETARVRFFNIFGPRQDPKSPYSGVIALFIDAMKEGRPPTIFGDGLQSRDFCYVENAVQALMKAAETPTAVGKVYNIGTGVRTSVLELVKHLNDIFGTKIKPTHAEERAGDIRHSQADISRARRDLGYEPKIAFAEGLKRTVEAESTQLV